MEYQLEAANKDSDTSSDNSNTSQQTKELVTDPENDEKEGTANTEKIPNELPEKFVFLKSVGRHFALVSFTLYVCFLCYTNVLFPFCISSLNAWLVSKHVNDYVQKCFVKFWPNSTFQCIFFLFNF